MVNIIQIILIISTLAVILSIGTLGLILAFNKLYFKKPIKKIIFYTILVNVGYTIILGVFRASAIDLPVVNYYLGIVALAFGVGVVFWIFYGITYVLKKKNIWDNKIVKWIPLIIFIFLIIASLYNFEKPISVVEYEIQSEKVQNEYTFVLFADTQLGSMSSKHVDQVYELVQAQDSDFVIFAGDLVDTEQYEKEDFDSMQIIDVPLYFVRGNHDKSHHAQKLLDILNNMSSIVVLLDEQINYKEIQITGIDYSSQPQHLIEELEVLKVNESQFSILVYHHPGHLDHALESNFDLMLAGHTHGGQIWPISWFVDALYTYDDGYYVHDNTNIFTTNGAGLWGPRMRLDSQNEIVIFRIIPE